MCDPESWGQDFSLGVVFGILLMLLVRACS